MSDASRLLLFLQRQVIHGRAQDGADGVVRREQRILRDVGQPGLLSQRPRSGIRRFHSRPEFRARWFCRCRSVRSDRSGLPRERLNERFSNRTRAPNDLRTAEQLNKTAIFFRIAWHRPARLHRKILRCFIEPNRGVRASYISEAQGRPGALLPRSDEQHFRSIQTRGVTCQDGSGASRNHRLRIGARSSLRTRPFDSGKGVHRRPETAAQSRRLDSTAAIRGEIEVAIPRPAVLAKQTASTSGMSMTAMPVGD